MKDCGMTEYGIPTELWFEISIAECCESCREQIPRDGKGGLIADVPAIIDCAGNLHVYCSYKCLCDSNPSDFITVRPDDRPCLVCDKGHDSKPIQPELPSFNAPGCTGARRQIDAALYAAHRGQA